MIKRPNDIPNYLDLVANLGEFGLSKYESMAYITLVSKGTLGASEIAYYSNLPRTKIYTTLKKLERKKLATISSQKPMIAAATQPNEAFGDIITLQERRLDSMHFILNNLEKLREEGKKSYEEKKYLILEPNIVVKKIEELISSSKSNIDLIFDYKKIIFIDSTNGKASLVLTSDPFGSAYVKLFDEKWKKAPRVNVGMLGGKVPKAALILSKMVENELSQLLLDMSMKQDIDYPLLVSEIEKFSSEAQCQSTEEIINIVDYALRLSYSGYLEHDTQNNILKLHSHSKDRSIVPWAFIIVGYIRKFGNDAQIIFDKGELKTNTVYIQLLHSTVIQVAE